jgi:hypothetical protein
MDKEKSMKKLIVVALMSVASLAQAHGYGYGYHHSGGWVAPALIGGVIGYQLAQPRTVVVQQQPVIVQQPQVVAPSMPYGYHYENVLDANCGCYRAVLVPN